MDHLLRHSSTETHFWNETCSLGRELLVTENWIAKSLLPGEPCSCQAAALAPDTLAVWTGLPPEPSSQLIPKAASGKLLIIPTEEKKNHPNENIMAEYGGLDVFLLLVIATCFPSSFGFSVRWMWPYFQSVGLGFFSLSSSTGFCLILRLCSSLWHSCYFAQRNVSSFFSKV